MPSKSPKQAHFMRAAANDPAFAKDAGIDPSVAQEFVDADSAQAPQSDSGSGGGSSDSSSGSRSPRPRKGRGLQHLVNAARRGK